jgi:hypothetical protein
VKRTPHRSPTLQYPNKWLGNEESGAWECLYRKCYIMILRHDNGKYVPSLHGSFDLSYDDVPLPKNNKFEFDSFKEAADHSWKYVDWVRDVWDARSRELFQKRLHNLRPDVYPA